MTRAAPRRGIGRAAPLLVLALALAPAASRAGAPAWDPLDLLQPGSRPDVGRLGDPFLSPLDDGTGFWSALGPGADRATRIESRASLPVGGTEGRARGGTLDWSQVLPIGKADGARAVVRLSRPSWSAAWDGAPGSVRAAGTGWQAAFGARSPAVHGFTAQAIAPADLSREDCPAATGAGLRWRAGPFALQAAWVRSRLPGRFDSALYGEPIAAALNLRTDRDLVDARVGPWRGLSAEYSGSWSFQRAIEARHALPAYELEPDGASTSHQVSAAWGRAGGPRALVRWTTQGLDAGGRASWQGLRFAQLEYLEADLRSWLGGLELPAGREGHWTADAEAVRLEARARGTVESWPFTSGLEQMVGVRMIGRALALARWTRWHLSLERPLGPGLRWTAGAAWLDGRPRATLRTWRPVFLVFGETDVQVRALDAHRVQLAALSLGGDVRRPPWTAHVAARQFVYAKAFRTEIPEPPGAPAPPSSDKPHQPWPGGTELEASITLAY